MVRSGDMLVQQCACEALGNLARFTAFPPFLVTVSSNRVAPPSPIRRPIVFRISLTFFFPEYSGNGRKNRFNRTTMAREAAPRRPLSTAPQLWMWCTARRARVLLCPLWPFGPSATPRFPCFLTNRNSFFLPILPTGVSGSSGRVPQRSPGPRQPGRGRLAVPERALPRGARGPLHRSEGGQRASQGNGTSGIDSIIAPTSAPF